MNSINFSRIIKRSKLADSIEENHYEDDPQDYQTSAIKNLKIKIHNRSNKTQENMEKHDQQTSPLNMNSCNINLLNLSESKSRKVIFYKFLCTQSKKR